MMGEPREPPDYEDAIQAFRAWVDGAQSFEVIDPDAPLLRPLVVVDDVRIYFEEDNHRALKKLISIHFPDAGSLWEDDIVPNNVAIFCTLLSISKGWWMKQFCHHGDLSDTALPFDPTRPPRSWPPGADFLPQFCEAQWRFCAPVLRAPFVGKRFPKDMVLPIIFKETLNTEGSSASLWRIELHPFYNHLISEEAKEKLGPLANTFVMKTYFTKEAEKYYNTEVAAFRHLARRSNPSIIKFYGSFTRGDSYNVILEYADKGTLADYFRNESPPSEGDETIRFWEAIFKLLSALRDIHEVGSDDPDGPQVFQVRHQDVKPENVLVVSGRSENRGDWIFKLADLGISNFKGRKPGQQDSAEKYARGTRTYGAPESYRPDGTYVHDTLREGQNSDIWSLGCIYSEAARWLKDGHRGIQAYRQDRQGETAKLPGFRDGDCFHDGDEMLKCVRQCHKNSVRNLRPEDFITRRVVEVLIEDMLGKAEARSTAYKLYERSKQLVINARSELEAAATEPEPSSLPKFSGRPRNRSFTAPNPDPRPPAPPNRPPGLSPTIGLHGDYQNADVFASQYVSPNNMPQILGHSESTSEPEGVANLRLSPSSPSRSHSPGQLSHQRRQDLQPITHNEPEDIGPISNVTNDKRPETWASYTAKASSSPHEETIRSPGSSDSQHSHPVLAVAPEASYESPSPPPSQSTVPTISSPYHLSPAAGAELTTLQRLASTRHTGKERVVRPKPVVIQGTQAPELPYLSLEDALEWRRKRKGNGPKKPLKDSRYLSRLIGRDHVFLIDDSTSMRRHWENVLKVFETVPYIVKEADPDGFDLWFTGPGKPLKKCRDTTAPLRAVETRKQQGTTDINDKLDRIFDDHIEALKKPRTGLFARLSKSVKPLSLYVFTDGVWEKDCNPGPLVENFVRQLESLGKVKGKVGIQFISFGKDPVGLERMELLDSGLNVKLDIVDTEPWNGNVWKMLLGAINDSFDKIHDKHDGGNNGTSSSSNRESMLAGQKEEYS